MGWDELWLNLMVCKVLDIYEVLLLRYFMCLIEVFEVYLDVISICLSWGYLNKWNNFRVV